jgi:hypothetical protein
VLRLRSARRAAAAVVAVVAIGVAVVDAGTTVVADVASVTMKMAMS